MTSTFLNHIPCPKCGSKDNRGVYNDGHEYCFGCKDYLPSKTNIKQIHCPVITQTNSKGFPEDAEDYIPSEPLRWLLSCGITYQHRRNFGIKWSPSQQLVCWKIGTLGWQGRCFSPTKKTKYISHGKIHEELFILWNTKQSSDTIVLVEDYLSAIRVSQFVSCIPLFGCTISLENLTKLKTTTDETN